jgi:putative hydrolase
MGDGKRRLDPAERGRSPASDGTARPAVVGETSHRPTIARKAVGAQAGAILGYVSRRVLGQFDVFLPPDDEGLIYFVGPNLIEVERRYSLVPTDFRLWVAIHEVTHRVQFSAAPWLRGFLGGMVDEYLETVSLDPTS